MTSSYRHGYVNDPRMERKYSEETSSKVKPKYVNEEDLGSSVQYDSIDYDELSKSDRAQDKHIYLDLKHDKEAGKGPDRKYHVGSLGKGASDYSVKKKGRWKFVVITAVLLILLVGVAIAFGVLYFTRTEVSPTSSPQSSEEIGSSLTVDTTAKTAAQTTMAEITSTTTTTTTSRLSTTTEIRSIGEMCEEYAGLIPHPYECQAYFNCSNYNVSIPWSEDRVFMECPYPRLFSSETMSCEHFEKVECGERKEAKNGCDYRLLQCYGHCIPCNVRYPPCEGKPDGYNVDDSKKWSPYYVICYKERFVVGDVCPDDKEGKTQLFSPDYDACVSLDRIPPEYGGTMPNCTDEEDGTYPDEHGRCGRYTRCAWGQYIGYETCSSSEDVFDEVLKSCRNRAEASYCTCGGVGCE